MGLILLDATVIAGFLDADDPLHEVTVTRLKELLGTHQLVASVLSWGNVIDGVCLAHHPQEHIEGFFDAFVKLLPLDSQMATSAARLARKHRSLSMPDALILGTADVEPEIETLLGTDPTWLKITGLRCKVELLQARASTRRGGRGPERAQERDAGLNVVQARAGCGPKRTEPQEDHRRSGRAFPGAYPTSVARQSTEPARTTHSQACPVTAAI